MVAIKPLEKLHGIDGIPVRSWATNQLKLPPPLDAQAYRIVYEPQRAFVSYLSLLYCIRVPDAGTYTHSHSKHILSSRTEQSAFQKPTEVFYARFSPILKIQTRGKSKILHPKPPCFWEGHRLPAVLCQPLYNLSLTDTYQTRQLQANQLKKEKKKKKQRPRDSCLPVKTSAGMWVI